MNRMVQDTISKANCCLVHHTIHKTQQKDEFIKLSIVQSL